MILAYHAQLINNMKIYDLIIIGGGPAGITAGIYAGRQKMDTLLLAKELGGGKITSKAVNICNFPGFEKISGIELLERFVKHLKTQQIETETAEIFKIEKDKDIFTVISSKKEKFFSKTVIIATGSDPRSLGAKGEKEFVGKGVGYCVTCDGPLFKNKAVAIAGGGNAGFEGAEFMERYASKIYILEYGLEVKADLENQELVKKIKKIEVITNAQIKEIKGDKFVNSIVYEDLKEKKLKTLEVQGLFIQIGYQPATALAKGLVDFNERDEIKVEFETFQTKTPGLFAVGDVNTGPFKQIVTACGEGCKAALAAYGYLQSLK